MTGVVYAECCVCDSIIVSVIMLGVVQMNVVRLNVVSAFEEITLSFNYVKYFIVSGTIFTILQRNKENEVL